MAFATIPAWSTTAGTNTEIDGISLAENVMVPSAVNNAFREMMSQVAEFTRRGADLASASTLDLDSIDTMFLDITGTTTVTAVTLTDGHSRRARATGAFQITASATLVVNGSTSSNYTTTAGDLLFFEGYSASTVRVWAISGGTSAVETTWQSTNTPINLSLAASVGSSALTIAIKGHDGNDPSASNKVYVPFRSVTAGSGDMEVLTLTAATSLVISSGSTMGFTSAVAGRLWIVGFNDGGTFRLGSVNCLSGTSIMALRNGIYSSTAEGGAGAADSAQVIYTGTAVSSKALTILGYIEATEATAGTWATAPSLVKVLTPGDALPGDVVQNPITATGTLATGATLIPIDNTIPQITEGDQYMTQAITPKSAANLLTVKAQATLATDTAGGTNLVAAIFRDATANALSSQLYGQSTASSAVKAVMETSVLAGSTSSTTFRFRAGGQSGTMTFNGAAAAAFMGGTLNSFIQVLEIMA